MTLWLAAYTLAWRELRHFYRDRARITGVVVQPLLFWLLIGNGMNGSFAPVDPNESFLEYFFPGILLMVIMFTAIFSTFSIIDDRKAGFLQGVLASPAPRVSIVLGKVGGGAILGAAQGCLFLLLILVPSLNLELTAVGLVLLVICMLAMGALLTCLGVIMAWAMNSTQGYHGLMSVVLLPMWVFSGSTFPMERTPAWLGAVMQVNPLTHGLRLMRACFEHATITTSQLTLSTSYLAVVWVVVLISACIVVNRSK